MWNKLFILCKLGKINCSATILILFKIVPFRDLIRDYIFTLVISLIFSTIITAAERWEYHSCNFLYMCAKKMYSWVIIPWASNDSNSFLLLERVDLSKHKPISPKRLFFRYLLLVWIVVQCRTVFFAIVMSRLMQNLRRRPWISTLALPEIYVPFPIPDFPDTSPLTIVSTVSSF